MCVGCRVQRPAGNAGASESRRLEKWRGMRQKARLAISRTDFRFQIRFRRDRPVYWLPGPPESKRLSKRLESLNIDEQAVPRERSCRGCDGISRTLSLVADPRLAQAYEGPPEQLCYDRRESMAPEPPQVEIGLS